MISALISILPLVQAPFLVTGFTFTSAVVMFSGSQRVNAESVDFYIDLGDKQFLKRDFNAALSAFNKALEIFPNHAYALSRRGLMKSFLKDYLGSVADLTKAIQLEPNDQYHVAFRGESKLFLEDYSGAIADLTKAIDLDSEYGYAYLVRGVARQRSGNIKGACSDWGKASLLGRQGAKGTKGADDFVRTFCE